jgi:DNA polymerase III alpha subunit
VSAPSSRRARRDPVPAGGSAPKRLSGGGGSYPPSAPAPSAAPAKAPPPSREAFGRVALRVRTEFSFGETFAPVGRAVERLRGMGVRAAGIVDSGGTWGHVAWDAACRKAGIVPMFGVALAVVRDEEDEERPWMWALARSEESLRALYRVSSSAQRRAARGVPRALRREMEELAGAGAAVFAGGVLDAEWLKRIDAILDIDPGTPIASARKRRIAEERRLRVVAVSDNAYVRAEDRQTFEMIVPRGAKPTPQHLMSWAELAAALPGIGAAEAGAAEAVVAEVGLPRAPLIRVEGDLEALCRAGIRERGMRWTKEYEARLRRELELIRAKDFDSYFLMVADMVRFAKQHMLVGPSRGSAAGSLVCYLTRITEIDPIKAQLIFERFIDVTRADLPDIDLDFVDSKRHLVIEYLREKYGSANVAQIGTVSTYQPKSALIKVAKQLNIPPWETGAVKDALFERSSGDSRANFALLDTLEQTDPGRKLLAKYPAIRHAAAIEAHASNDGVHAAGIIVCNEPIEHFCTVGASGVAQLDKRDAERLNLLKIDVLGLRTLGVLEDSGVEVDWYGLGMDDPEVFRVLNEKRYAGIFQFEGQALQSVASQMRIESLDDIGHITALARPGPLASGGAKAYLTRRAGERYSLPSARLEPYVNNTFGVVIYQEQVLSICRELGRMSWEDVTLLRKAMSKSLGREYFDQFRSKFLAGTGEEGIDEESAVKIWEMVNTMGSWAFNLAHSYSYAVVSYWTAWLKAHHPLEFAAATLRNARADESVIALLRELKRSGQDYIAFDPERSEVNWSVQGGQLIGGFLNLKGIGTAKAAALLDERARNGGRLPAATLAKLRELEVQYADPFPTETRWGDYYAHPERYNLRPGTRISRIEQIAGEGEFVYIGQLVDKNLGDHNEPIRIARRKGKRYSGQTLFLDLKLQDDTGSVLTRIDRFEFEELGRRIWDEAQLGSWWIVRGERKLWGRADGGFKMIYVKRIAQLD